MGISGNCQAVSVKGLWNILVEHFGRLVEHCGTLQGGSLRGTHFYTFSAKSVLNWTNPTVECPKLDKSKPEKTYFALNRCTEKKKLAFALVFGKYVRMETSKHYAMQWRHNAVDGNTGRRCADYYWFPSRKERDAWVEEGAPYVGPGCREPVASSDSEIRVLQRLERAREERGLWIQPMN